MDMRESTEAFQGFLKVKLGAGDGVLLGKKEADLWDV